MISFLYMNPTVINTDLAGVELFSNLLRINTWLFVPTDLIEGYIFENDKLPESSSASLYKQKYPVSPK